MLKVGVGGSSREKISAVGEERLDGDVSDLVQ